MLEILWKRSKKRKEKVNDTLPTGISKSIIPSVFIDGNKNPIWDNNHKLLKNSKKETFEVW